jgi:hypothetical protein
LVISSVVKRSVGADDFAQEGRRILDPNRVAAEGPQPDRPEFRVAQHHRVLRPPFLIGKAAGVEKVDFGLERAFKAMPPSLQGRENRQIVGFQLVHAGLKGIGELAFVDEHRDLPFAHGQLGPKLDFVAVPLEAIHQGIVGVIRSTG